MISLGNFFIWIGLASALLGFFMEKPKPKEQPLETIRIVRDPKATALVMEMKRFLFVAAPTESQKQRLADHLNEWEKEKYDEWKLTLPK